MSKRERVLRTMRHQETDRVPVYDILQNDGLIEYLAGERLTVENGARVKGRAIARCLDMTRMADGPRAPGLRVSAEGLTIRDERWTSWIVERPWRDWEGLLAWVRGEIERVESLTFDRDFVEAFYQRLDRFQGYFGDDTVQVVESGVGLTEMYWAVGWENFAYLLADEPEWVIAWLDARHRAELRRVQALADPRRILVALPYDDIACKSGPLISPHWLRQHWFPRLARLVDAWHARDTFCLFHSDGNLWPLLDDLVAAGIDGLNPIEVAAGMTVREVRKRYPQLFLTGGVDVSQLLPLGTPEEVRAACEENIRATNGRGYFLGSTTELHWEIPLENILAMFRTAWGKEI
ncbi:MAG: hypothetical protein H5T69_08740 [Chloroflexi bacterium]|nr:hypothetical protein [Chloroflexota bacterium]